MIPGAQFVGDRFGPPRRAFRCSSQDAVVLNSGPHSTAVDLFHSPNYRVATRLWMPDSAYDVEPLVIL